MVDSGEVALRRYWRLKALVLQAALVTPFEELGTTLLFQEINKELIRN
jgi:hypothetical protein